MAGKLDDAERVHPETRADWRTWLASHHATATGVWFVSWKAATGKRRLSYDEQVEEALCFGWVDSKPGKLDDERAMLWFAPRKPTSAWSRPNKERVERLLAAGLIEPAGLRVIEAAKANGAWSMLDEVEDLVVPDDLAAAFDERPGARAQWDAFPRSARRGILEWIVQAKKPETRATRITDTADRAAKGERANQWPRR